MDVRLAPVQRQGVDLTGVTELRVHGVGGTTPEQMLYDVSPRRVAGDHTAGFYRSGAEPGGRHLEAYSWGGLTSKSASRVLWLLLLPFAFANLAGWMHRRAPDTPEPAAFRGLVRLAALGLTLIYVLWVFSIAADLVAYQCGAQEACVDGRWWLAPLGFDTIAPFPGRRVLVGTLAPIALIGLLWFLTRTTRTRYEDYPLGKPRGAPEDLEQSRSMGANPEKPGGVESPHFWQGRRLSELLTGLHVAAAFALLAIALVMTVVPAGALRSWSIALALVALVAAAIGVCVPEALRNRPAWIVTVVAGIALVLAGWLAANAPSAPFSVGSPGPLPNMYALALGVFAVHAALLVLLGAELIREWLGSERVAGAFRWAAPLVAVGLATLTLSATFGGSAVRVADLLGAAIASGTVPSPELGPVTITYPSAYNRLAVLLTFALLAAVGMALVFWVGWRMARARLVKDVRGDYKQEEGKAFSAAKELAWLRLVARKRFFADSVHTFDLALTFVVLFVLGLAAADFLRVLVGFLPGGPEVPFPSLGWLATLGTLVASLIPLAAIALLRSAYRSVTWRRRVGILWDVGTFWPRAFHPLAPPSYAERAVPELSWRIERISKAGGAVIVSAHSQGTVLAAASLLQLDEQYLPSVDLVTHGSPLTRLYAKTFPAYFNDTTLARLQQRLTPSWRNYYRPTDPIGSLVFRKGDVKVDVELPDPSTSLYAMGDPYPPVLGHSDYYDDQAVRDYLTLLKRRRAARPRPPAHPAATLQTKGS